VPPKGHIQFKKKVQPPDEIFECHHATGAESFILRAAIAEVCALEALIEQLTVLGPATTSAILSTASEKRQFVPVQQENWQKLPSFISPCCAAAETAERIPNRGKQNGGATRFSYITCKIMPRPLPDSREMHTILCIYPFA
jgi:hypothetical protein